MRGTFLIHPKLNYKGPEGRREGRTSRLGRGNLQALCSLEMSKPHVPILGAVPARPEATVASPWGGFVSYLLMYGQRRFSVNHCLPPQIFTWGSRETFPPLPPWSWAAGTCPLSSLIASVAAQQVLLFQRPLSVENFTTAMNRWGCGHKILLLKGGKKIVYSQPNRVTVWGNTAQVALNDMVPLRDWW
jgi:hypothetical protein